MTTILAIASALLQLVMKWLGYEQRKRDRADGAAEQRDIEHADSDKRISDAVNASDAVKSGGGVPTSADPFNRDNASGP